MLSDNPQEDDAIYQALAHPIRRAILSRLMQSSATVTELVDPLDVSQSAVSQHLKILRDSGLVQSQRQGRRQVYHLTASRLEVVFDWLEQFQSNWETKLDALGDYLDSLNTEA